MLNLARGHIIETPSRRLLHTWKDVAVCVERGRHGRMPQTLLDELRVDALLE